LFTAQTVSPFDQLWTTHGLPVDGLRAALRRFRKSHHLIRAGHHSHPICSHRIALEIDDRRGVPALVPSDACVSTQA
jgi:hypothetical protein